MPIWTRNITSLLNWFYGPISAWSRQWLKRKLPSRLKRNSVSNSRGRAVSGRSARKGIKIMQKMTLQDLKDLFPPSIPGKPIKNATQKGAKHEHKPARKPSVGNITPAQYRRKHLGRHK